MTENKEQQLKSTYRAMQISKPGILEPVTRAIPTPNEGEVLIQVEACGICGADIFDIDGASCEVHPPRVPGHEVVGKIIARGKNVSSHWSIGKRVGVGRLGGPCNDCDYCRQGNFQYCSNQPTVGSTVDGGYAEVMLSRSSGLVSIPDELSSISAAPILCAGIATFNALRKCGAQAGDTVAICGIGGLGHMAIQYAKHMGYRVIAVGRGEDIRTTVTLLGAHHYIDTNKTSLTDFVQDHGLIDAAIMTINNNSMTSAITKALAPKGQLVLLGVGSESLIINSGVIVGKEKSLVGSITGMPFENEKALNFSVLTNINPMVETLPLEQAIEAYQRMKSGKVNYRMVLTI